MKPKSVFNLAAEDIKRINEQEIPTMREYINQCKHYSYIDAIRQEQEKINPPQPIPSDLNDMILRLEEITANGQKNYTREAHELVAHIKLKASDGNYMFASKEKLPEDEIRIRGRKYIVTSEYVGQINDRAVDALYRPTFPRFPVL